MKSPNGRFLSVVLIYRSPNEVNENKCNLLKFIKWLSLNNKEFLLLGDFNLPNVDWQKNFSKGKFESKFLKTTLDLDLHQHVHFSTRISGGKENILDLVFTKGKIDVNTDHYEPIGNSDHLLLIIDVKWNNEYFTKNVLDWSNANIEGLKDDLERVDWDKILLQKNIDLVLIDFNKTCWEIINKNVPNKIIAKNKKIPWFDRQCLFLKRQKRKAWRNLQKFHL